MPISRLTARHASSLVPRARTEYRAISCIAALDAIVETGANGNKVTLVNFGTFDSKKSEPRVGRNPQTNKPMDIPGSGRIAARW